MIESTSSRLVENLEHEPQCVVADLTCDDPHYIVILTECQVFFWEYSILEWHVIGNKAVCLEFLAFGCIDSLIRLWDSQKWTQVSKIGHPNSAKCIIHLVSYYCTLPWLIQYQHLATSYVVSLLHSISICIYM
eukprot:TRINITY_DN350_c0_g1_i1.p1 TRINITY_DN350_c0_g1~~TRINITY_DN350_c0_g1_i1.p1  ORF type:complete len:133 (-),score=2.75 TRINITY_DN350_c0_g1_i1:443-841(-)